MAINTAESDAPLYERVYTAVRELILDGILRPGESVSEVQLSRQLEVSRTPVREAVKRLVAENLLQTTTRGSLRVYAPTIRDIAEIYHARALLEGAAAGLAAIGRSEGLVEELEAIVERARTAAGDADAAECARLNTTFHETIIEAAQSDRIASLITGLNPAIVRYRRLSLMFPEHVTRSLQEHERIVLLMRDGSPEDVETHVRRHILRAGARVVRAVHQIEGGILPESLAVVRLLLEQLNPTPTEE